MSDRSKRVATASWAVTAAAGLAALAALAPAPGREPCGRPAEARAAGGFTRAVRCDGAGGPLRGPARLLYGLRLDANRAAPAALEALPGVGPARAAAIARARGERPFADPAELARVPGIGPATARALRPYLEVRP